MKALICHRYGPVDTMRVRTIPDPRPKPNEVVVDVAYAPVDRKSTRLNSSHT